MDSAVATGTASPFSPFILFLTSIPVAAINVDVTGKTSMTLWLCGQRPFSKPLNSDRKDVRESGEIPLLPRNCERLCFAYRRLTDARMQKFSQASPFTSDEAGYH
jgi:hypothetical protein